MPEAYTTVDAVIVQACHKLGDMNLRKYAQLLAHALTWFSADYNAESGQTLRTVLLDIGPDRIGNLPDDFLDWVVVAQPVGERLRTLAYNGKLSPALPGEPWLHYPDLAELPSTEWPRFQFTGWDGPTLYGYGWGEYRAEFSVDMQERTLRVSSLLDGGQPLFLQYVSADLNPGKPTPLHPAYALSLEYWMLWQMSLRPPAPNATLAREYERQYYIAKRRAQRQLNPFSHATVEAILRQSYNIIR